MIYIVIPVYNRIEYTEKCLRSLLTQNEVQHQIIVVDDGSTDGTSERIQQDFPEVTLLRGDGDLWWVRSTNWGIRHALEIAENADYVLVINDDLIVNDGYLLALLTAAEQNPKSIIGSVETTQDAPRRIKNGGGRVNWITAKYTRLNRGKSLDEFPAGFTVEVSKLTGRGTLFSVETLRHVGIYDEEHFTQCGDTELPVRAALHHGYKQLVAYDAVVISYPDTEQNINTKQTYTLADFRKYFFDIRSHFNLADHFWFAYKVAPNPLWFIRFVVLEFIRNVGHYIIRLRPNTALQ